MIRYVEVVVFSSGVTKFAVDVWKKISCSQCCTCCQPSKCCLGACCRQCIIKAASAMPIRGSSKPEDLDLEEIEREQYEITATSNVPKELKRSVEDRIRE